LSFIPTVNNQVAKFVHFILHLFLFFLYPLLITPFSGIGHIRQLTYRCACGTGRYASDGIHSLDKCDATEDPGPLRGNRSEP